jgi:hypothetical protein
MSDDESTPTRTGPKPKTLVKSEYHGIPVGRDNKVIDPVMVEKLAGLGCKDKEIANFFGIAENTLRYNFSENLVYGRENLKVTLRTAMIKTALSGNAAVQIFLAKNLLGMKDAPSARDANLDTPPLLEDSTPPKLSDENSNS